MKRTPALLVAILFCVAGPVYALYGVIDRGEWPTNWPEELEPLRKQARTLVGPEELDRHYAIPFTKRDQFESAWPHLLEVNINGAPLVLVRGANFFLGKDRKAGVVIHCPPLGKSNHPARIELVVDGEIVDLNRIPLPDDTPILDERFKDREKKSPKRSGD